MVDLLLVWYNPDSISCVDFSLRYLVSASSAVREGMPFQLVIVIKGPKSQNCAARFPSLVKTSVPVLVPFRTHCAGRIERWALSQNPVSSQLTSHRDQEVICA